MVKTKSKHHKSENTHQFQSLHERLKDIKVEVGRKINRNDEKPEDTETYFYNSLEKWVDLNYTALFHEFSVKVKMNCRTLAILVFNKQIIVETLIEYIGKAEEISLQPLLDLTVQLSRDLQNDFYVFFPKIFDAITQLLDTQNTDTIEWAFQSLSYLFKFLWRYMLRDLDNVYNLYSPLFHESRKDYIRNFAAECFAFLMRKVTDKNYLFDFFIMRLASHPEESKGISQLIFGMFKGVQNQFNACTEESLEILLNKINFFSNEENLKNISYLSKSEDKLSFDVANNKNYLNDLVFCCISKTFESMANYTKKQHTSFIWKVLYKKIDDFYGSKASMNYLIKLINAFLEPSDCYLIEDLDDFLKNMEKISNIEMKDEKESDEINTQLTMSYFHLIERVLLSKNLKFPIEKTNFLPEIMYNPKYKVECICQFSKNLFQYSLFEKVIIPNLFKYFDTIISNKSEKSYQFEKAFFQLLAEYLIKFKDILKIDCNYLDQLSRNSTIESSDTGHFLDVTIQIKSLTQIVRCLQSKKNEDLIKNLTKFATESFTDTVIQKDICVIAPFLFQQNSSISTKIHSIKNLNKLIIDNIEKIIQDETSIDFKILENNFLVLSLATWSLIMMNHDTSDGFESLCNKLNYLEKIRRKGISNKSFPVIQIDKSLNHLLRTVNLCMIQSLKHKDKNEILKPIENIFDLLKNQLSSPYHQNRLISLNIINEFAKLNLLSETETDSIITEEESILINCIKAESTTADLDDYRQKLIYIQRLDPLSCKKYFDSMKYEKKFRFDDIPLRFLFGLLFENFKLIWEPIISIIQQYANSFKMDEFWSVFGENLSHISSIIESEFKLNISKFHSVKNESNELGIYSELSLDDDLNIDYSNVRFLLCSAMQGFSNSCEAKTRILIPLFFNFINNEYYMVETRLNAKSLDDLFVNEKKEKNANKSQKYTSRVLLNKYLCGFLNIFSKFTSPTSWFQESLLKELYMNLLCHNETSVQKAALSCLYPYKYSYLSPYKDHLERLLEGKYFRNELIVFSLNETNGLVHTDHRQNLLPILMRLLYGKFYSNETTHTSSKETKTNKRSTIIQFLSQCSEKELNYFFNLLFDCLNTVLDDEESKTTTPESACHNNDNADITTNDIFVSKLFISLNNTDGPSTIHNLEKVIPLKKLLGVLHSLEIIIHKLARKMDKFSHRILQIICFIHKYALNINELASNHKSKNDSNRMVNDYYLGLLRVIRQQATLRFKQFFDTFDHQNFSQEEHLLVMDSFVWPLSSKLIHESLKSVSNLLKIFYLWSERPYYYPLLVIKTSNFELINSNSKELINNNEYKNKIFGSKNILQILFELIDSTKCSQNVIDYVMDMVYNLVTFADFKEEEKMDLKEDLIDLGFMDITNTKPLPFDIVGLKNKYEVECLSNDFNKSADEINFGTLILKPHVSSIINHIELIVSENLTKKNLPSKPLKILARLSCFSSNSTQQCKKIIQLLVSYLIKNRKQSEELEINILNSINNLLKQIDNPQEFIGQLSRLFSVVKNRSSRNEVCKLFITIKNLESSFEPMAKILADLNSWDIKRIEEPDYLRRLDAFKSLNKIISEWTSFDINQASLLFHNCFFFIKNVDDLAIKESSTNCVKSFLKTSATLELTKADKTLLESNFINEIKNGLREKNENARHECVKILVEFINSFKHIFPKYEELSLLMDKEDVEKDFYDNITHIQMHRRSRALKRLQRFCDEKQISSDNVLSFMMPLVRSFVDNEMYHKYDYIIEEACNTIGSICYILAWPKYFKVIDYYLKILNQPSIMSQKLIIKILVSALDAFHFDLSNSTATDYFTANKINMDNEDNEENESIGNGLAIEDKNTENSKRVKQFVSKSLAFKIHTVVTKSILPALTKCLTKRLHSEDQHKMNKKVDMDEQIIRVPMALAILKLLKNLPAKTFEIHLPGLLYKVCEMLKSRAISVRNTTRECLIKMIITLPDKKYYSYVFKELSNSLTRGYQVHVLSYTIQMVLKQIENNLNKSDLDSSLDVLVKGCCLELFSDVSEEKEENKIIAKTPEAKQMSSYSTLEVVSRYISPSYILDLIKPFKQKLDECNSNKLLKKIEESLKRIMIGLLKNESLNSDAILVFIFGLVNDTFDMLKNPENFKKGVKLSNTEIKTETKKEESCLLLSVEPKRGGDKPKVQAKTNQHVIVEFALQLLNHLIKSNRIDSKNSKMLDPYLKIFLEYLDGRYVKLTIVCLRCLIGFLKFTLPSLDEYSSQIASKLFILLQTYSSSTSLSAGQKSNNNGDNFELLMVCFKVIANLIRDCEKFSMSEEQLQVLMHYAERNLYDNLKQTSAFNLIKAVLSRKLKCDELTDVIAKVMKLSIQADSGNVRLQSRQTILQYILDYSLSEKNLVKFLEFYIIQLNYEYENGRESALEMMATIFNTFPTMKLNTYASRFFLPLAIQLHNDESSKCKKLAYLALKQLIDKISNEQKDSLFNLTLVLLVDEEKALHKRIAILLIKVFVEVETEIFEKRLEKVFDLLIDEIDFEKFNLKIENSNGLVTEKFYDQYLFNTLTLIMKILTRCNVINSIKYRNQINKLFEQIKIYLVHDHLWVRLVSCQLFGFLFSNNEFQEFFNFKESFLNFNTTNKYLKLRDLIDSFVIQLKSPLLEDELAEQIIKNLAYLAKITKLNPGKIVEPDGSHDLNIEWLIKKILKEANYELVKKPNETIKRTYVFKWIAALVVDIGKDDLKNYLNLIIPILQRESLSERNDESKFENLKKLAQQVLEFIKQTVGVEEFSLIYSKSHLRRIENKEQRKRNLAQANITDPQLAAIRKIRKMQKKKEVKKRKMNNGDKNPKKIKFNNSDDYNNS